MEIFDPHELRSPIPPFERDENNQKLLEYLNSKLDFFPSFKDSNDVPHEKCPIIFIVGAPRSGTTYASQLITRNFDIGYVSNVTARFWKSPIVGLAVSKSVFGEKFRSQISDTSLLGTTYLPWEPHEFGNFWRYWFNLDKCNTHKLSEGELKRIDSQGLNLICNQLKSFLGTPFVFKNLICGLQMSYLHRIIPNSIFLYIERNSFDAANSILDSRILRYGRADLWWSVKPANFADISIFEDPFLQAHSQVISIQSDIEANLSSVNGLKISFLDLVSNQKSVLSKVQEFVRSRGYTLNTAINIGGD